MWIYKSFIRGFAGVQFHMKESQEQGEKSEQLRFYLLAHHDNTCIHNDTNNRQTILHPNGLFYYDIMVLIVWRG